jgi:hypothetical protein
MIFFVVFTIMGLGFIKMGSNERVHALNDYRKEKAYYYAHHGIHKGLWLANKVSAAAATFSNDTVSVVFDSVGLVMTANGIVGAVQDSIKVTLQSSGEAGSDWPYAIFTDIDDLRLDEGTGTVNGDVHSNFDVDSDAGYTINGTITEVTPYVAPPTIDWNFFKTEAQSAGQYFTGTLVFNASGSPYTGVWYTTGTAEIYGNAVINGTVVSEDDLIFRGDGSTITATPSNYPALLSKAWIRDDGSGNYDDVQIAGLVYTDEHFDKDFDDFTLTGAIIALDDFHHSSSNFVVTYDANYVTNVAGTDIGGGTSVTYTIVSWEEL